MADEIVLRESYIEGELAGVEDPDAVLEEPEPDPGGAVSLKVLDVDDEDDDGRVQCSKSPTGRSDPRWGGWRGSRGRPAW